VILNKEIEMKEKTKAYLRSNPDRIFIDKTKLIQAFILLIMIAGCDHSGIEGTPSIVSITPANGAVDFPRDSGIRITFNGPMDSDSCEERFGLFEHALIEIPAGLFGHMNGTFIWNPEFTEVTFHSNDLLPESHIYSLCLLEGMQPMHSHHDDMMGDHSHLDGMDMRHMSGLGTPANNGVIIAFTTL